GRIDECDRDACSWHRVIVVVDNLNRSRVRLERDYRWCRPVCQVYGLSWVERWGVCSFPVRGCDSVFVSCYVLPVVGVYCPRAGCLALQCHVNGESGQRITYSISKRQRSRVLPVEDGC